MILYAKDATDLIIYSTEMSNPILATAMYRGRCWTGLEPLFGHNVCTWRGLVAAMTQDVKKAYSTAHDFRAHMFRDTVVAIRCFGDSAYYWGAVFSDGLYLIQSCIHLIICDAPHGQCNTYHQNMLLYLYCRCRILTIF